MNLIQQLLKSVRLLMTDFVENKVWSEAEIKISEKAVGSKVELIDADGQLQPAPDGNYELDNGFKFTVKDGLIESIEGEDAPAEVPAEDAVEAAEVPADEQPKEDLPAEPNPEVDELKVKVADLESKLADLAAKVDEMNASVEVAASKEEVAEFTKAAADLNKTILQLAKVPVQFSQTSTNNTVKDSKEQKLVDLAKILNSK
ncbi:hypothetical protein [Flaviaesturariibacter amylovorans]|uniref:Uncharacterized protein n=1 Tax=Flaviaesturariibacter amylovorans TaxID=1084520 RepID=A0ABP8GKV0_9BACT